MATGAHTSGFGHHKRERREMEPVGKRKRRGRGRVVDGRSPVGKVRAKGGQRGRDSYGGEAHN